MEKLVFCKFFLWFLYQLRKFSDMSDFRELYGSSFLYFHSRVFRENDLGESEFYRFIHAFLETEDILHDSSKGYLSEKYPSSERFIILRGNNRCNRREINSRFGNRKSSGDIYIHVVTFEFRVAPFGENRDEKVYLPVRDTTSRTLRIAELGISRESFYLDDNRAIPFQSDSESRTGQVFVFLVYEFESGIRYIDQSVFCHPEKPNLIGRTETIFESPKNAIIFIFTSFKKKHCIDQMFENLGSRYSSLFGHVSDENNGTSRPFRELHKNFGNIPNLCNASRL